MPSMGLLGIYGESLRLTWKLRVVLSQVAGTLILPLILIIFVLESVLDIHQYKVIRDEVYSLDMSILNGTPPKPHKIISEGYSLVEVAYRVFILGFSLLSTSAVVYTIGSSYASREITYRRIMSVVPRLWKRLAATLSCTLLAFIPLDALIRMTFGWGVMFRDGKFAVELLVGSLIVQVAVLVYAAAVWQMASVVTVMEEGVTGLRAVRKAFRLTRGKKVVCLAVSGCEAVVLEAVYLMHPNMALMSARDGRWGWRDMVIEVWVYGGACALVWMATILFGAVVQTVLYMVCKLYHHEEIDNSALADHLEAIYWQREYLPLQRRVQQVEMAEV